MTGLQRVRAIFDAFDTPNGQENGTRADNIETRRRIFTEVQEAGRIAFLDGGGERAAALVIETDHGRLVRVELTRRERANLAAQLCAMGEPS